MKKEFCQSCAMPLEHDPQHGGTEADGSRSEKYCSYCYQNGAFTVECNDVKVFQQRVMEILRRQGYSKFKSWLFTRGFSRLERWHKPSRREQTTRSGQNIQQ